MNHLLFQSDISNLFYIFKFMTIKNLIFTGLCFCGLSLSAAAQAGKKGGKSQEALKKAALEVDKQVAAIFRSKKLAISASFSRATS